MKWQRNGRQATFAVVLLLLNACGGDPAGEACSIEGSGFTASHDCASRCLSRWQVNCPGGERVSPQVCAGRSGCEPGTCPQGQVCYHFDDPFELRSYCIPDDVCGQLAGDDQRRRWERDSMQAAAAMRASYAERRAQRKDGAVTAPVDAIAPDQASMPEPAAP